MLIQSFAEKVEAVQRFRRMRLQEPARIAKALAAGYRVTLPFAEGTETFIVKGPEVARLLAEFPGVDALWKLFPAVDGGPTPGESRSSE